MAKYNRLTVGSIVKSKDAGSPDYFKIRGDTARDFAKALMGADPQKGMSLKLESKAFQLKSIEDAKTAGKLSEENANKAAERVGKIPDYVRFEVVLLSANTEATPF